MKIAIIGSRSLSINNLEEYIPKDTSEIGSSTELDANLGSATVGSTIGVVRIVSSTGFTSIDSATGAVVDSSKSEKLKNFPFFSKGFPKCRPFL